MQPGKEKKPYLLSSVNNALKILDLLSCLLYTSNALFHAAAQNVALYFIKCAKHSVSPFYNSFTGSSPSSARQAACPSACISSSPGYTFTGARKPTCLRRAAAAFC